MMNRPREPPVKIEKEKKLIISYGIIKKEIIALINYPIK